MKEKESSQTKLFFLLLAVLVIYFLLSSLPISAGYVEDGYYNYDFSFENSDGSNHIFEYRFNTPGKFWAFVVQAHNGDKQLIYLANSSQKFSASLTCKAGLNGSPHYTSSTSGSVANIVNTISFPPGWYVAKAETFKNSDSRQFLGHTDFICDGCSSSNCSDCGFYKAREIALLLSQGVDPWYIPPKQFFKENLGYPQITDFKKHILEHSFSTEYGQSFSTSLDCEYKFSFDRYSSLGIDLLMNSALAKPYSNSDYDLLDLEILASPSIYYVLDDNEIIQSSISGKTFLLEEFYSAFVNYGYSVKLSYLNSLIPEAYSELKTLMPNLIKTDDHIFIQWKLMFRIIGRYKHPTQGYTFKDFEYGPSLMVTLPSSWDDSTNPQLNTYGFVYDSSTNTFSPDDMYQNSSVIGSTSSGQTWDEVYFNGSSNSDYQFTDVFSGLKSLLSQIGNMPQVISTLFSFYPPWVQAIYTLGFALIGIIFVVGIAKWIL